MESPKVISIDTVIEFVESHLDGKLDLDTVTTAVHYSKYHLHRMLRNLCNTGITIVGHTFFPGFAGKRLP